MLSPWASIDKKCLWAIFYKSLVVEIWLESLYKDVNDEADFELYDIIDLRSWCNIWKLEIFHGANSMCLMKRLYFSCNIFMIWFFISLNGYADVAKLSNLQIVWFLHCYFLQGNAREIELFV